MVFHVSRLFFFIRMSSEDMDSLSHRRGTTITVFIFLYALSSFIGGYAGGGYYARNEGKNEILD